MNFQQAKLTIDMLNYDDKLTLLSHLTEKPLDALSTIERFFLTRLIYSLRSNMEEILRMMNMPPNITDRLIILKNENALTQARVGVALLSELIDKNPESWFSIDRTPFEKAPMVIFVSIKGTQVPSDKPTIGLSIRDRKNIQPPLGPYFTAGLFYLFGLKARVYNLALGITEMEEMLNLINQNKEQVWLLSFNSNFFTRDEIIAIQTIYRYIQEMGDEFRPRFLGGGMGMFFNHEFYLKYTPIEMILNKNGGITLVDMILSTDFRGPTDKRHNAALFGDLPNLLIWRDDKKDILYTPTIPYKRWERKVMANRIFYPKVDIRKYWRDDISIGVCVTDDLNVVSRAEYKLRTNITSSNGLSVWNYIERPRSLKIMTIFGNCPRGCKFCQYTNYDTHPYFLSPKEVSLHIKEIIQTFPELEMFIVEDDDFALFDKHARSLADELISMHQVLGGRVFSVEAAPVSVSPDLLRMLHKAGFRAILLGVESPVEHVVRHTGKIKEDQDFDEFWKSPFVSYDSGYFTRATVIVFYPTISERDLPVIINGILDMIEYGVNVVVFPMVKALPGTYMAVHAKFIDKYEYKHKFGNNELSVDIPEYVLPENELIRRIARKSLKYAHIEIDAIIRKHSISGDYPSVLNVAGFIRGIVRAWREESNNAKNVVAPLEERLNQIIVDVVRRHKLDYVLREYLVEKVRMTAICEHLFDVYLNWDRWTRRWVKNVIDFGSKVEVRRAFEMVEELSVVNPYFVDYALLDSLEFSVYRFQGEEQSVMRSCLDRIAANSVL